MKHFTTKSVLLTFVLGAAIGCAKEKQDSASADDTKPAAAATKTEAPAEKTATPTTRVADNSAAKLLVLKFHHDSWGGCQAMGPIVKATSEKYADKSIKFVTFDFTSDATKAAAEAEAKKLGVDGVYAENAPKTGFALLYDTVNKKVVTKLSAKQDVAAWSAEIDKAFGEG